MFHAHPVTYLCNVLGLEALELAGGALDGLSVTKGTHCKELGLHNARGNAADAQWQLLATSLRTHPNHGYSVNSNDTAV